MPAVITHTAIMLLARDRLREIRDAVDRLIQRRTVAGDPINPLETKIRDLSARAWDMLSEASAVDPVVAGEAGSALTGLPDPLNTSVSRFAVMGAMGPDIPGFSELFNPGQAWVFDTIHKGTPDYNRETVHAGTTDFALSIYLNAIVRGHDAITDDDPDEQTRKRDAQLHKVRAYILGHLCHVAADVVSHPMVNDLEWHPGTSGHDKRDHGYSEVRWDAKLAERAFRRSGVHASPGWQDWYPEEDSFHPSFFDAYADAFRLTYGEERPPGFKDFEEFVEEFGEPELSGEFLRHGYRTFRGFGVGVGYDWGWGEWFGMLAPLFVPIIAAPWIAQALPHARTFFQLPESADNPAGERAGFELAMLGFQMGAPAALLYGSLLLPYSARGAGDRAIGGVVLHAITTASLIITTIEGTQIDDPDDGIPAVARWMFLFVPPAVAAAAFFTQFLVDAADDPPHLRPFNHKPGSKRRLLDIVNMVPLIAFVLIGIFLIIMLIVKKAQPDEPESPIRLEEPGFWVTTLVWSLIMLGLWIGLPFAFSNKVPNTVDDDDDVLEAHGVRLFDDTALSADPAEVDPARARIYPSDYRPVAKLWWEGAGDMEVRSDRFGLTFRLDGSDTTQTVPGPLAPMTPAEFIQFLRDTVADGAGETGSLNGAVYDTEDAHAAYLLPSGAVFAGHGDTDETEADIVEGLGEFDDVGSDEGSAYLLYHAPKLYQAVEFGPQGPFLPEDDAARRSAEGTNGYTYVVDTITGRVGESESIMARAADLASLLCMGAADHLSSGVVAEERVYQVFRNWNLDRRRVNEWRMLVAGGALSDKPDGDETYDNAMPAGLSGPTRPERWSAPIAAASDAGALAEAAGTANGHGWTRVLRDWVRALEDGEDLLATTQDRPHTPTNRALSRALAYILDAPDPAEPPAPPGGGP